MDEFKLVLHSWHPPCVCMSTSRVLTAWAHIVPSAACMGTGQEQPIGAAQAVCSPAACAQCEITWAQIMPSAACMGQAALRRSLGRR